MYLFLGTVVEQNGDGCLEDSLMPVGLHDGAVSKDVSTAPQPCVNSMNFDMKRNLIKLNYGRSMKEGWPDPSSKWGLKRGLKGGLGGGLKGSRRGLPPPHRRVEALRVEGLRGGLRGSLRGVRGSRLKGGGA